MSTANKLERLLQTKSELKSELNKYLDNSILIEEQAEDSVGSTEFKNYKNFIQKVYTGIFKKAIYISGLFYGSNEIKYCPLIESETASNISNLFRESTIEIIEGLILPNATTWTATFHRANKLHTIGRLNLSSASAVSNVFSQCSSLVNVNFEGEINCDMLISNTNLTHDSLMSMINHLKQGAGKTITFGSTLKARLSSEELDLVTSKGWYYDA